MYCARLDHFARFNADGTIGKCGHMVDAPRFGSWQEMQDSPWLNRVRTEMLTDQWPQECRRCQATEPDHSIRMASNKKHAILKRYPDYIILGGVLDNVCNSACQSCNADLSTKIGSLQSRDYIMINNIGLFDRVPAERIRELDINGGEPTASPNYRRLLEDLPASIQILRVNTNGSRLLPNIETILEKGTHVIITLSLDGTDKVHDYVRWPVRWANYQETVDQYQALALRYRNLKLQSWTTLHALNIADFDNIRSYAGNQGLDHSWAYLENPRPLNLRYTNHMSLKMRHFDSSFIATDRNNQSELDAFISAQNRLRGIDIQDYL